MGLGPETVSILGPEPQSRAYCYFWELQLVKHRL